MSNLKWRLATIGVLVLLSVFALFPRDVKTRQRRPDGTFFDTTMRRVPLRKGLDLSGGMHLALEVDESKGAVVDKSAAIDRALKVVRTRIEGMGVSETVIQKAGNDRIIIDIPGIDDRERAIRMVQDQAFLAFQITDKTGAFEKVLPRLDAIAKARGFGSAIASTGQAAKPDAGLNGLLTATGDTSKAAKNGKDSTKKDSTKSDTAVIPGVTGGVVSKMILAGQFPGEFLIERNNKEALKAFLEDTAVKAALPPGKVVRFGSDSVSIQNKNYGYLYLVDERPIITGESLKDAKPNTTPEGTVVEFQLDNEGGRKFQRETAKHIKDYMAIVLDNVVMGRPPIINGAIGTRGQITMGQGRDLQSAQDLSLGAARRCAAGRAQGRRGPQHRPEPRTGLDQQGVDRRFHRACARRADHVGVLSLLGNAGRCRAGAVRLVHDGDARELRCGAYAAGTCWLRALHRYRG